MASNMARNDEKRDAAASPRKIYLTIYNITFAALWFSLLITTIITLPKGRLAVFAATSSQARWVQTASLIEVLHAATGTHSVSNASVSRAYHGRNYQIPSQHDSSPGCNSRHPGMDGVVLLPAEHDRVVCVLRTGACVVDR
jgi:hypothetical protein